MKVFFLKKKVLVWNYSKSTKLNVRVLKSKTNRKDITNPKFIAYLYYKIWHAPIFLFLFSIQPFYFHFPFFSFQFHIHIFLTIVWVVFRPIELMDHVRTTFIYFNFKPWLDKELGEEVFFPINLIIFSQFHPQMFFTTRLSCLWIIQVNHDMSGKLLYDFILNMG